MQNVNENPYRPYTQNHENWRADLERQQRLAREEKDANDRHRAELHENQAQRQRQVERDRQSRNQQASRHAPAAKQAANKKPVKPAEGDASGIAKLIGVAGAITGAVWAYKQQDVRPGEEINWLLVIGASVISGTIALKLYQVILAILAILAIGWGISVGKAA